MAQSDQIIQNDTGANVRADINNNLAALYSLSSGSSEPSTTTAHQLWLDTSTSPDTLKIRNSSDSGWILIGDVSIIDLNSSYVIEDIELPVCLSF